MRTIMQRLLNICENYGREYHVIFDAAKSETIFFGTDFGILKLLLNRKPISPGHLIGKENIFFQL